MIEFPSPILSVSPEVVKDLDGEDALYGMWTVFTKCKQSLKDGRRLENMSWRLWYREMSFSHSSESLTSGTSSDTGCPSPITPVSENGPQNDGSSDSLLSVPQGPSRHSWHGGGLPPPTSNIRRLSTASMPGRRASRSHHQQCVGSILMEILPDKLQMPSPVTPCGIPGSMFRKMIAPVSNPSTAKPSPVQTSGASTFVQSTTPKIVAPIPTSVAQLRPPAGLPTMQLPSTPSSGLAAPRVVVVNPTPHPTPPATPHPTHSSAAAPLPPTADVHLSPPPARPLLGAFKAALTVTPLTSTSLSRTSPPVANQNPSAPSQVEAPAATLSRQSGDETLKPSDRRFFLRSSLSPEKISPERPQLESPELPEPSPSSTTSSNVKSELVAAHPRRNVSRQNVRRGRDAPRFTSTKSAAKVPRLTMTRKVTEPKKPTFNIGSASSNGTKAGGHGQQLHKAPVVQQSQAVPRPRPPSPPKAVAPAGRKGLAISTSSDYSSDSDDDSGWASDGANSGDEKEKERKQRESKLREAAEEAQRQRDMFAKVPKRSYTDLTKRTRSGLLSQLLNPDPALFPPSHPYRQSHSSQDITQFGKQGARLPPPTYQTSKSSAAVPLAAQITPMTALAPSTNGAGASTAYRPKGRPQGQELETDTEEESVDNALDVSHSLAQQRLAALAGPSRRRASDQASTQSGLARSKAAQEKAILPTVSTAPIPLNHPYNLPPPVPPMTPRTTRRQMLSTELSESLRRNLLWERQVSKVNMLGGARRGGVLGQRLQPLTAANPQQGQSSQPLDEREERRRAAMARNRSWADEFHQSGW
ncbi:hypothetical protein BC835DRAFT_1397992 [Cytidiella melzeri]|nr:hypothetical protein BC835DRAFT_1397992 [Cytidiella melzeri]